MDYATLNKLAPETFLNWEQFKTNYPIENDPKECERAYQEGLKISQENNAVYIMSNGCWGATTKTGGFITSYEGIGYHALTAWKLKGFLDGLATFAVYRAFDNEPTIVKPHE